MLYYDKFMVKSGRKIYDIVFDKSIKTLEGKARLLRQSGMSKRKRPNASQAIMRDEEDGNVGNWEYRTQFRFYIQYGSLTFNTLANEANKSMLQ